MHDAPKEPPEPGRWRLSRGFCEQLDQKKYFVLGMSTRRAKPLL
jgi:hypothetical protein